jgi:TPR repeat protein
MRLPVAPAARDAPLGFRIASRDPALQGRAALAHYQRTRILPSSMARLPGERSRAKVRASRGGDQMKIVSTTGLVLVAVGLAACAPSPREQGRPLSDATAPIHDCDRLAAQPMDHAKAVAGVYWERMDGPAALAACEAALRTYPDVARFRYQHARALEKTGNAAAAAPLYGDLARAGYTAAKNNYGIDLVEGVGGPKDIEEGTRWITESANDGNGAAKARLGGMFERGEGVPQAADLGEAGAQYYLGVIYLNQTAPGPAQFALQWFKEPDVQQGTNVNFDPNGLLRKGRGTSAPRNEWPVRWNETAALHWYERAARQGNAGGAKYYAFMRLFGLGGKERDEVEGLTWLLIASPSMWSKREQVRVETVIRRVKRELTPEEIAEAERRAKKWEPELES